MPPRFDADALVLELSVADLLDIALLRHIGFGNRGGYERMWLGQAIHSHYQEQKLAEDPAYHREVVVTREIEHRGWTVRVQGRVDGLRRPAEGPWVVEEIKSVRRGATLSPTTREIYARQAQIYAWMLAGGSDREVIAELVLIEIGGMDDATQRETIAVDLDSIDAQIRRKVNAFLRARDAEQAAIFLRKSAGERLRFPYPEVRPGQEEIQAAVDGALERGDHLLLQAPTGLGKTVAALYPALRYALLHDKRLFILTAKTLQQEMASEVIQRLAADGGFKALRIRAKAKMCANGEVVCHEEYCRFAKDFYLKLETSRVVPSLLERHSMLQPEDVFERSKLAEVCPFEVSLELARRAQVVICDYNYAFDPYAALSDFAADADLSDTILLIDEAHNLVDRGRGYYSPELDAGAARSAGERMRILGERGGESLHFECERVCLTLARLIEDGVSSGLEELPPNARAAEAPLPEDALWSLRTEFDAAFVGYLEWQRENKAFRPDDPFVATYFALLRFLNGLMVADHSFSKCVEIDDGVPRLRILCKDPSRFLGKTINRAYSTIAVSATLSPNEFYRDLLGFDPARAGHLEVASPFPREHRRIVVDTSVTTVYAEREANVERIAERLSEFTDAVPGNCLALFPSYDFLAKVAERLKPKTKRVLVQRRADSDAARDTLLATLRSALLGDVLLLAVAGGVFAEGVDYPGDVLRAVAVVGPCLPAVTLEQELLKAYYDERFQRGFEFAFVVPGMTRVVQAAGRLIRSAKDQGVIALFDRRFLQPPYRDHLPSEWIPEEGAKALVGHPGSVAMAFFESIEIVN